ncbi:UNVERIFIED_ORG: hypothetical protein ABIB19_001900 [Arthrobacter sp. UYEF10]
MTTGRPWNRSLERIRLIGDSAPDHHSLRTAVIAELGRVLPVSAFVWPISDPLTATGISPIARIPCPDDLPLLIRLKYLTLAGRWTRLAINPSPATTLLLETAGNPSRSLVWEGLMKRYGVTDVLFAVLADKHGCWGWLDLWRTAQDDPFTAEEVGYIAAMTREVMPALRRSIARQFLMEAPGGRDPAGRGPAGQEVVRAGAPAIDGGPRPDLPQQAVLTLDAEMAVVGRTASVEEWLGLLQPGPRPFQRVPAEVLNVAAQLLAREAGVDCHPASARVHIGWGQWALLQASRIDSTDTAAIPPLAVTI